MRHYERPLHRDRLFLLVAASSVLVTVVFVALVVLLTGLPDQPLDWLRPAVLGLLVALLSFRLLGMGVTSSRTFQEGLRGTSGEHRGAPGGDAPVPHDFEATGRAAGAVVGQALRATRAARTPSAAPDPGHATEPGSPAETTPTASADNAPATPAATPPRVDATARVAGAMLGRRLAERRRRHEEG
ncbi:hypothetical protein [Rhabdothermincola salaria]|uniref:hypothetical protein n=1 Tax=Rhabdothermincola salaria TaxID=2903142 RepID=UPI001E35FBCB|nr:hypothetical protein [Rhabdothermincola salaria]MCD9625040.1 hypothetical protein [Rhabdothermincola salaria]